MNKEIKEVAKYLEPKTIKTIGGEIISLPKITLGKELRIMQKFFVLIGDRKLKGMEIFNLPFESDENLEKFMEIVSDFIGKPSKWCEDNLDMTHLIEVIVPFFIKRVKELTNAMKEVQLSDNQVSENG